MDTPITDTALNEYSSRVSRSLCLFVGSISLLIIGSGAWQIVGLLVSANFGSPQLFLAPASVAFSVVGLRGCVQLFGRMPVSFLAMRLLIIYPALFGLTLFLAARMPEMMVPNVLAGACVSILVARAYWSAVSTRSH